MKRLPILILTIIFSLAFAQSALCVTGNISGYFGFRALDKDDWEPVDDHLQFGAVGDITPTGWPVAIAVDLLISVGVEEDEYVDGSLADIIGSVTELDVGVRKIFNTESNFSPYIGGGLAFATATREIDYVFSPSVDDDDSGVGIWVGGGFYALLGNHFNVGLDLRFSSVEVELFNEDVNAGGFQLGALVGYHW
jgi:hypothetical protein